MGKHKGGRLLVLVSILLAMLLLALPAQAQGTVVSIPDATINEGNTVTLDITINDVTDLAAADIWLAYDKDVVTVGGIADGDLGELTAQSIDNPNGVAKMNWFSTTAQTGSFTFASITLHASATSGSCTLDLQVKELTDISLEPILYTDDDGTFTVTKAAAGGGGGGFEPAPPGPPEGTTDVSGMVSEAGVFQEPATALSEDGLCTFTIPEGTVGLTAELEPLTEINILEMDDPPPPPEDAHVIGLTYDFGPDGVIFDPPITLIFSYDPADILEGVAEEDLVIAWYDEAAGEWVELEGCVVDPETNTITAPVSHFTAFGAMFIPTPAAFSLSALEVSPAEVETGGTVTISALVENTGEKAGILRVTLKVNGTAEQVEHVALDAGASTRVSFTTSGDAAGSYAVDVNGLTGSFTVKEKPAPVPVPPTPAKPLNWPLLGGIIAGVVVVGLLIFFLVRRRAY